MRNVKPRGKTILVYYQTLESIPTLTLSQTASPIPHSFMILDLWYGYTQSIYLIVPYRGALLLTLQNNRQEPVFTDTESV